MLVICNGCGVTHWSLIPWKRRSEIFAELAAMGWDSTKLPEEDRTIDYCEQCRIEVEQHKAAFRAANTAPVDPPVDETP